MYLPNFDSLAAFYPGIDTTAKRRRNGKTRDASAYRAEPLETRILLATIPVTLHIYDLLQVSNPDEIDDGDYYAEVTIGNNPEQSTELLFDGPIEGSHFDPQWFFTSYIDPADGLVPVKIQVFDFDDVSSDEVMDINPFDAQTTLEFSYDPVGGLQQGVGLGNGDGDDDAQITFEMFNSVGVKFTVTRVDELDDPDSSELTESNGGDYAFGVKIGGYKEFYTGPEGFTGAVTYDPGPMNVPFTVYVNPTDIVASIDVRLVDYDTFSGNETMDINPRNGETKLSLYYNLSTEQWDEQGGGFSFPVNVSQGNNGNRARLFFNINNPDGDADGDGLPNTWETQGIDINGDGTIDLQLNSDPFHKDVFVEVDTMQGRAPIAGVLQSVINAFANAPNSLVNNPDGQNGITLNILLDETNIPVQTFPNAWTEFDAIKTNLNPSIAGGFGTVADRTSVNAANILAAKRAVYRYAMFADAYGTGSSSGLAEIGGNDFFITLGSRWTNVTANQQAGTFMHEMGHTLGLLHGGNQAANEFNFKPNYYSLMNYTWQFPFQLGAAPTTAQTAYANSWVLDYSRSVLGTLDENSLSEANGLGGPAGNFIRIGPIRNASGGVVQPAFVNQSGPVDLNGNGPTTDVVARDLNFLFDTNDDGVTNTLDATPGQVLTGFEDWSHLLYSFRNGDDYQDGIHTEVETSEMTFEAYSDINQLLIYAAPAGNGADNLTLRRNGDTLEVFDNNAGLVVASRALADTRLIQIIGADGEDDTLTVDFKVGGYFAVPDGIEFRGGAGGNDRLKIVGTGATTGAYTPSSGTPGDGSATVALGAVSVAVSFTGLEPVEVSGMASYALVTPNSADVVTVNPILGSGNHPAHIVAGTSDGIAFETLTLFDIDTFTLDTATNDGALAGDSVAVALGSSSTGLDHLRILTGGGDDTVSLSASRRSFISLDAGGGTGDTLAFNGESFIYVLTGNLFDTLLRKAVTYTGFEALSLASGAFGTVGTIAPNVIVNNAATLGGVGIIQGTVSANAGGTVAPGVLGLGLLRTGSLALVPGADFDVWLNGLTPGFGHSQVRVTGTVNLGGSTLDAHLGLLRPIPGDELVLIRNDGSDAVVGKFAQGDLVTIGGKKFAIDYAFDGDGDGQLNDVALIAFGAALAPDPCNPCDTALYVSGTTGDDIIRFISASGNKVKVLINGQDQGTFKPTGKLIAFGQSGSDKITVELPSCEAWLYGQGGEDTLQTGNGDSILIGGLGDDKLTAGNGKDLLIGGLGADTLEGGNGDDLLIAGATVYDTNTDEHLHALCRIQDEWQHGSGGYSGRISHLRNGGGRNGSALLNSVTVIHDNVVDRLTGGTGTDWFLVNPLDLITDKAANETATLLP